MPKYTVYLQQYVEMVATFEVTATDELAAKNLALEQAHTLEWKDGDDAYKVDAYAVHDENNNVIWER